MHSAMRATSGLKAPGMAIGSAAQAARNRRPGEARDFADMGAPLPFPGFLSVGTYHLQGGATASQGVAAMNRPDDRRPARTLLVLSFVLLLVFLGLAVYHKFFTRAQVDSDQSLLEELQAATVLDDEPPGPERTDWPQWRGIRRDGVAFEPHLLTKWPADGPKQLWQVPGGQGHSSFTVRDGLCYTMVLRDGRETVLCLHSEGGKEKWHFDYEIQPPSVDGG